VGADRRQAMATSTDEEPVVLANRAAGLPRGWTTETIPAILGIT
jgi:hypothetical protein